MICNLYKKRGETPLECMKRFAKANPEFKGQKMTYLGRLDPLAEGVLLMATGEDVKRKEEFLELDKEYDFVSLFGFATDTCDILGKIVRVEKLENLSENEVRKAAAVFEGEREQRYPFFSSKTIAPSPGAKKKALHELAREGILNEDDLPSKRITIHKMQFHKLDTLNHKELFGRLLMDISRVNGNFRQHEILALWKQFLGLDSGGTNSNYFLGRFTTSVSSGTYIRGIVSDIGNTLGIGATTLSIKRNRVGEYLIKDSIK